MKKNLYSEESRKQYSWDILQVTNIYISCESINYSIPIWKYEFHPKVE